jgi:hypothetical protein
MLATVLFKLDCLHLLAKSIKIGISETIISHLSVLRQKPAQLGPIDRGRIYKPITT